ncbi:MAG: MBL fold metallo-hydrolase [Candidatus Njordarchaeales archaeon]
MFSLDRPTSIFEIRWWGHACFSIYNKAIGLTIIFDPFRREIGKFSLEGLKGDIILCSHDHFDHANWQKVAKWDSQHFIGLVGDRNVKDVKIRGILTYHDDKRGKERGTNTVYVVGYGDGVFVHLGDLGHTLSQDHVERIRVFGRPHVLFIPIGGVFTIGPKEAVTVIRQVNPHIVIPMHYYSEKLNQRIFGKLHRLDDFLNVWGGPVEKVENNTFELNINEVPEEPTVYVLRQP